VVYTLAITQLKSVSDEKFVPSFSNLKEYLMSFLADGATTARLLCLDDCGECGVYVDGEKVTSIESFFDENVEVYRYDFLEGMRKAQNGVYFNEENLQQDLCFSLSVDKFGVAEQLFVLWDEKVYDYTTYFSKTQRYGSLEEAQEAKELLAQKVLQ
jgi:hypothetical protein